MNKTRVASSLGRFLAANLVLFGLAFPGLAQTLAPDFAGVYTVRDLGTPADVPGFRGAILFKTGDPSTLLLGGATEDGEIYQIKVQRDAQGHVSGFSGGPTFVAYAPGDPAAMDVSGLYAGWDYGPNGVLFYATFDGSVGQIKPGGTNASRYIRLADLNIDGRGQGLVFVPPGLPGAGRLKITGPGSGWLDTTVQPDGSGTFDILQPARALDLSGPYGVVYIPAGRPGFANTSVLVAFAQDDEVRAYGVDADGDPVPSTARTFISSFYAVVGAIADPLTGDLLFSSSDVSQPRVIVVGGAAVGTPEVRITAPADGARFRGPATFSLDAEAKEEGGLIARVEFYQGTNLIDTTAPPGFFSTLIEASAAGTYAFTAVAYDAGGRAATSQVVRVSVVNEGPIASLLYPTNNTTLRACSDILMTVQVQAGNSEVAKVEFRDGNVGLGTLTTPSDQGRWSLLVRHVDEGEHSFAVQVTDNNGLISSAIATNVVVQPLPLHTLAIHHYNPGELMFCFKGSLGASYAWEKTDSVLPAVWRPFLTNTAPAGTLHITNQFDETTSAGFFRTRKLD